MNTKLVGVFLLALIFFGYYYYYYQKRQADFSLVHPKDTAADSSEPNSSEKLRYLTTDWESMEKRTKLTSSGEYCYGDEISYDGKTFAWRIIHFNSPKKVFVRWGACTHEPYSFVQIRDFLQTRYPNRQGNWEGTIEAP